MNGCVSMGVNVLSMADAFRYYRDELGLHVYPVDGPWSKREGAGKKPSIAEWWKYDPQDCNIEAVFNANGGGRCHNIGFAPRNAIVVVDLDSKRDQGGMAGTTFVPLAISERSCAHCGPAAWTHSSAPD